MRKVIDVGTDGGVGAGGDGMGGGGFTLNGNAIVSAQYGSASLTPQRGPRRQRVLGPRE